MKMKNELFLEGKIVDIEFNGINTRFNIECGNCTDEHCDTDNVCSYAKGNISSKFSIGDVVCIKGHIVNDKENVLVWVVIDEIQKEDNKCL